MSTNFKIESRENKGKLYLDKPEKRAKVKEDKA